MLCTLCHKHSRRPKKTPVGKAVWVDLPCNNLVRQSLVRHSKTDHHFAALELEMALASSVTCGQDRGSDGSMSTHSTILVL